MYRFFVKSFCVLKFAGNITETMKIRRMNGHTQNNIITPTPPRAPPPDKLVVEEEELAPAPAASYHNHNHNHNHSALIRSCGNITDEDASKVQVLDFSGTNKTKIKL